MVLHYIQQLQKLCTLFILIKAASERDDEYHQNNFMSGPPRKRWSPSLWTQSTNIRGQLEDFLFILIMQLGQTLIFDANWNVTIVVQRTHKAVTMLRIKAWAFDLQHLQQCHDGFYNKVFFTLFYVYDQLLICCPFLEGGSLFLHKITNSKSWTEGLCWTVHFSGNQSASKKWWEKWLQMLHFFSSSSSCCGK